MKLLLIPIVLITLLINISTTCQSQTDLISPESEVNPIDYYCNESSLIITATAFDNESGVKSVCLYYFYSPMENESTNFHNPFYGTVYGVDTEAPWEWTFTFPQGNGYYSFYSEAVDNAGNDEYGIVTGQIPIDQTCFYQGETGTPIWFYLILIPIIICLIYIIIKSIKKEGKIT
jgi:hypothetical protein